MDTSLLWAGTIIAATVLAVHGAYYGALAEACLKIGTSLEGAGEGTTGFQDAITPPSSTNARLLNWLLTLLLAGGSWYILGVIGVVAFLAVRVGVTVIFGAILKSDPPKKHFCQRVYHSICNREADYAKAGDQMRTEAMGDLRARFERSSYASELEHFQ